MEYKKVDGIYLIRLDRGEEVQDSLIHFAEQAKVEGGYYHGIGTVQDVELGYFSVEKNDCTRRKFYGSYELISLNGNISKQEGHLFPHTHVSLADANFALIGGHLFGALVSVTAEICFSPAAVHCEQNELNPKKTLNNSGV